MTLKSIEKHWYISSILLLVLEWNGESERDETVNLSSNLEFYLHFVNKYKV